MNSKFLFMLFCLFVGAISCFAQNTLNFHQKDGIVASYAFSEKPVVTYTGTGIHLLTTKVEVDYPLANLEKWTFEDGGTSEGFETITTEGTTDDIRIYTTDGVLVRTIQQSEGAAIFSTTEFPTGIYIIKNGKTTYKITKR